MYGYGYYGWGMDPTILLLVIGMLLSLGCIRETAQYVCCL